MLFAAGCPGRDPLVTQRNADAVIEDPPPPPPPTVRQLTTRPLFGTLPVENRFLDPLLTFTASGWFAFSDAFNDAPIVHRVVASSPTSTPFLKIDPAENDHAVLLGQLKSARSALHIELWLGRDGDASSFDSVEVSVAGLFAGTGESTTQLRAIGDVLELGARSWQRFAVDLAEGPIGWSYLMAGDTASEEVLYIGGPAAIDLEGAPSALLGSAAPTLHRPLTTRERAMIAAVQERTRSLGGASATGVPASMHRLPESAPRICKARGPPQAASAF
ncbi:MAG: hypothetical protein A2138_12635 [Deltaproteobacteria bacterium RBG_16_71_12]|nr:MAG: hypothetical protein A2138_12635 [Deltaproteobacteria bacterium RBG_16_71_12]